MVAVTSIGFPLFVAVLSLFWYRLPAPRRWWVMTAASAVFYLLLDARGLPLLMLCAAAVWQSALRLQKGTGWFVLGVAGALGPLLLLKYSGMFIPAFSSLWQPLGLSYFSLQLMGYLLDVKRGSFTAEKRYWRVFCYAGFFLSITQGPFNHYDALMPQLEQEQRFDGARIWRGMERMAWGYFKKYAIADRAAVVVNEAFLHPEKFDTSQLLFGAILFAFQLYADFSGYTDIVLGAGECLGLTLPENFRQPYLAQTIGDFWSRWHISLSGWLNEYVFEPLSWGSWANRWMKGQPVLTSLMITFLISGLWHGAAWNFVVWGALNGLYQVVSAWTRKGRKRFWKKVGISVRNPVRRWWQRLVVFGCVVFGYVFFRATGIAEAFRYLHQMLTNPGNHVFSEYWLLGITSRLELLQLLFGVMLLVAVDLLHEKKISLRDWVAARPMPVRILSYEVCLLLFLFMGYFLGGGGFLYARF